MEQFHLRGFALTTVEQRPLHGRLWEGGAR